MVMFRFFGVCLSMMLAGTTLAEERNVALLASACAACHGTNGYSRGSMPRLAGLDEVYFERQMSLFQSGERESTIMERHAKGYTEQEIRLLAQFFARQ